MDADFSNTDYMLFEETADAGLTSDEVIHNILSVCRKPANSVFDKMTDEGIISPVYNKYNEDVLLDEPGSPPMNNLLAFGPSTTMDSPEEITESVEFGNNIYFDQLLATTDIGEIEECYTRSVSSGGDFLDNEENDLTLFKELQEDGELCCPSDRSVSSTCLDAISEGFEENACNDLNDLEQTEAEKSCRVQFFKMSSLKDNRRCSNGLNDHTKLISSQIHTELCSDQLNKRYVLLVDGSDDEIEDNRSLITFLEFDPTLVVEDKTEVSCQNNEPEFSNSYDFYLAGKGKEIPASEVVSHGPTILNTGNFILDYNQNLNLTSSVPALELEGVDKIKGSREELRCANETTAVIDQQSEITSKQIEEELVLNSEQQLPQNLRLLEHNEIGNNLETERFEDGFDSNNRNLSRSDIELQLQYPDENVEHNADDGLKINMSVTSKNSRDSDALGNEQDICLVTQQENRPELPGGIDLDSDEDKRNLEAVGEKVVDDLNNVDVPQQPESNDKSLITDSEEISIREITETNSDEDSSVSTLQGISQERRIEKETSELVDHLTANPERVIAQDQQESGDKFENLMRETGNEFIDEYIEPSDTNTELESDEENRGSKVNALQFMLLREMWRAKGPSRRESSAVQFDLGQNEVFIALLKEFLMKKNCHKYMPQLTGIDIFIKERNIQAAIKTKKDNIESQKETCLPRSNQSLEEQRSDNSIIDKGDEKMTELDVPRLETEKVVESNENSSSPEEDTLPKETPTSKNNSEIEELNGNCQTKEDPLTRKELRQCNSMSNSTESVLEANKTVDSNLEARNLADETGTDKTNNQNITDDKSIDDACSPVPNCSSRDSDPLSSNTKQQDHDTTITDGQCSSNVCDFPRILRLEYLKDISFQPFVKLELLNLRGCPADVEGENDGQENRNSHRRISPRIAAQLKHYDSIGCELLTSRNGNDRGSESSTKNGTIKTDTIQNIILPESPKSPKTHAALIMTNSIMQPANGEVYKAVRTKKEFPSKPVIAQTTIMEKINSTNTLVPRLERIDTLLDLPMKSNEPLRPLKIIYEIGRKLSPTISDIYQNRATRLQRKLSMSQKYHIRKHRRKQSNTNIEKSIPEILDDGIGVEGEIQEAVPVKSGDASTENLKEKEISNSDSKELRSERPIGSNLSTLRDERTIETTRTVGKTLNKSSMRVLGIPKLNVPIKRMRDRPRCQDSTREETENKESTCTSTRKRAAEDISKVVRHQQSDKIGSVKKHRTRLQTKNLIQRNPKIHELLFKRTRSTDNMQLKELHLSDHEEQINDSVVEPTQDSSGSEVNQYFDEIPLVKKKRGNPTRQDSARNKLGNKKSTCPRTREEALERTSETVVNQQSDNIVLTEKKRYRPRVKKSVQRNRQTPGLLFNGRTKSTDSAEQKIQDTSGSVVDQRAGETPLIEKKRGRQPRQDPTSRELENIEFSCTTACKKVSERAKTVSDHEVPDDSEMKIAQSNSGSVVNQHSDGPIKRKRGRLLGENLIQKKPKADELSIESRRIVDTTQLRKLTVVLDHEELINNLPVRTTQNTSGLVGKQHSDKIVPMKRRRGRQRCQDSYRKEQENKESTCAYGQKGLPESASIISNRDERISDVDVTKQSSSRSLVEQGSDDILLINRNRGRPQRHRSKRDKPENEESMCTNTLNGESAKPGSDHEERIDDSAVQTPQGTSGLVLKQHSAESVPIKRKRCRPRYQASSKKKLEDNESVCTNTAQEEPMNDLDQQHDVPIKRKRYRPRDKNPVQKKAKPNGVLRRALRSTDTVQLKKSSCLSDQVESDDQTKKPEQDKNNDAREDNQPQITSESCVAEKPCRELAETLAKDTKPLNCEEKMKSDTAIIDNSKTVDSAIDEDKKTNLSAVTNSSEKQNDKQVVEVSRKSSETVDIPSQDETVGTIRRARNNLHNELYKLYFTNFFTSNGHDVRFQHVSGKLAVLDAKITNADKAESFVKAFAQFDCANYLLWKDFDRERYILHRTWLCGTNGHQNPDVLYKSLSCQARIHISIKQPSSNDYNAHILIYMEHTHNSMSKEKLVNISK